MDRPTYILAAAPSEPVRLNDFFESGDDSIMALLERPPVFRQGGWDLRTATPPRIVSGEYLEAATEDDKVVRLYEDGTLLVRVAADSFLAWPMSPAEFHQRPKLNTLGLVEVTTAFVYFYRHLLGRFKTAPENIRYRIEFRNAEVAGNKLYVVPFPVLSIGWQHEFEFHKHPISEPNLEREMTIPTSQVNGDPDLVACLLVEQLFLFFGVPSNELPYVHQEKPRRVDVGAFSKR
jgi:hypothetical protein